MVSHTNETLEITINGERRRIPAGLNVRTLLQVLEIPAERVAVELNRVIVRPPEWNAAAIEGGAELEIVHFVGGG